MFYDESYYDEERERRRAVLFGWWGVGAYLALVGVAWLFLTISLPKKDQSIVSEGVMVAFGDVLEAGAAGAEGVEADPADASSSDNSMEELSPEDMLTQDHEDAPAVAHKPVSQPTPKPVERPQPPVSKPTTRPATQRDNAARTTPAAKPEEQRKPNPNALFPGRGTAQGGNNGAASGASQGATSGVGQQGDLSGAVGGNPMGSGQGSVGTGFNLAGRSLVEALPVPRYNSNKRGRVVVNIRVNELGRVISALPGGAGQTTNDSELVSEAVAAARRAQFNSANEVQTGTITYNFVQN